MVVWLIYYWPIMIVSLTKKEVLFLNPRLVQ